MNVQKFIYSIYAIFERMFKIFRIQQTQIVKEFTLFCTFKVRNFSKNIHSSLDLTYTSYRKVYTLFFLFFSIYTIFQQTHKKTINSTYTNFLRMFEILHFQQT